MEGLWVTAGTVGNAVQKKEKLTIDDYMSSLLVVRWPSHLLPAPLLTSCPQAPDFSPHFRKQPHHSEWGLLNSGLPPYSSEPQVPQGLAPARGVNPVIPCE